MLADRLPEYRQTAPAVARTRFDAGGGRGPAAADRMPRRCPTRAGQGDHRIIASGDLNMADKLPPERRESFPERERTVFARMAALGLELLGPRYPHGRSADRSRDRARVSDGGAPTRLRLRPLGLHESVRVRALNAPEDWGASDH